MRGSSYFFIIIMVFMLVMISSALKMKFVTSKLLPLLIGSSVLILAIIGFLQEIVTKHKHESTVTGSEERSVGSDAEGRLRSYLPIGAWVSGFFLAIYLFGFLIAIPIFSFAYMKSHGSRALLSVIATGLITAFVYGMFEVILRVELYRGLFLGLLGF